MNTSGFEQDIQIAVSQELTEATVPPSQYSLSAALQEVVELGDTIDVVADEAPVHTLAEQDAVPSLVSDSPNLLTLDVMSTIYTDQYDDLLALARRRLPSQVEGVGPEDIVHLALERIVRRFGSDQDAPQAYDGGGRGYLTRTVINLCFDQLRRQQSRRSESVDPFEIFGEQGVGTQAADELGYAQVENSDLVAKILELDMPENFKRTVILYHAYGLSYEEIASELGMKVGTVKSSIHRGLAQIRTKLAGMLDD